MLCGKRPDGTDIKLGDALANGSGYDAVMVNVLVQILSR